MDTKKAREFPNSGLWTVWCVFILLNELWVNKEEVLDKLGKIFRRIGTVGKGRVSWKLYWWINYLRNLITCWLISKIKLIKHKGTWIQIYAHSIMQVTKPFKSDTFQNWSAVDLQYCVRFWCTAKWLSKYEKDILFFFSLFWFLVVDHF